MDFIEKELEMRGMKRIEIVNYFISMGGKVISDENFIGNGWEVEISEEKTITLGSLKIPATIVILRCREDLIDGMMVAFRLRFLSAGG
ncbi:hypothetical protein G9F72_009095 [Clostridium estertheticum]|uniref:hypothetical protein n=1 Tax=Clostridium estertheticum TaxID=238834 RepID=UPI0013E90D08|nr:hypothetical protein [Clostridium estertheticum]MBZ9686484.1 hypothetical protein [Clostridium estertheticum]